jgi:cysteine desulfurase
MRVYLDNAATTALDPAVAEIMYETMKGTFGNPSSIHTQGREAKTLIERSRKTIAGLLGTAPAEIFFTSGGTEADNTALVSSVASLNIKRVLTSKLEHHAVLHTLQFLEKEGRIELFYVEHDQKGQIDLNDLETKLKDQPKTLVSLMHANNEIGNLLDIKTVASICKSHGAVFHSDAVQTIGHQPINLTTLGLDFAAAGAHKFHGPKGVGFLYCSGANKIHPYIHGGAQERNMRGGTENLYGIVGMAKALEIAIADMDHHKSHILSLKESMIRQLIDIPGISFNGLSNDLDASNYTVLNVAFPTADDSDMLLFNLDINKIDCSGGSACSSGTDIGSHVLEALSVDTSKAHVRFSFGKYNTQADIDFAVKTIKTVI